MQLKLRWPIKQVTVVSEDKKVAEAVKEMNELLKMMCNAKSANVVNKKPAGDFAEIQFDLGTVMIDRKLDEKLMEEALLRELIREIQSMRKQNNFNVNELISLTLNSNEKTISILKNFQKEIQKEVGASKIVFGKKQGKYKSQVKFEEKIVEVAFDKS